MATNGTILLKRSEIAQLLDLDECIAAVERAFRLHGEMKASQPGILGMHAGEGGFHINEEKQEIDPALSVSNKVVVDVLEQCAAIGDLHHTAQVGLIKKSDIHAELGQVVAGHKPGRVADDEIIIFDGTGMALQDAAAAVLVYEKAMETGAGLRIGLS